MRVEKCNIIFHLEKKCVFRVVGASVRIERRCPFAHKNFHSLKIPLDKIIRRAYIYCMVKIFLRR